MAAKKLPEHEFLVRTLKYDAESGLLLWKSRPDSDFTSTRVARIWNTKYAGKMAGNKRPDKFGGGVSVVINNVSYLAHRLAWKLVTGDDIEDGVEIDHVNLDRSDNRWANLRLASRRENGQHRPVMKNSKSGLKGVFKCSYIERPWIARIRHDGKDIHLGAFHTKGLAAVAYAKASLMYQGKFSIYA